MDHPPVRHYPHVPRRRGRHLARSRALRPRMVLRRRHLLIKGESRFRGWRRVCALHCYIVHLWNRAAKVGQNMSHPAQHSPANVIVRKVAAMGLPSSPIWAMTSAQPRVLRRVVRHPRAPDHPLETMAACHTETNSATAYDKSCTGGKLSESSRGGT